MKSMPSETTGSKLINLFNSQVNDSNHIAIQGFGNGFMTTDNTGTKSPVILSAGGTTTLQTPSSAYVLVLNNTGANSVTVTESATGGAFEIAAGAIQELEIVIQATVIISSVSGSTVNFFYKIM